MKILIISLFLLLNNLNEINGGLVPAEYNKNISLYNENPIGFVYEDKILEILEELKKRMCHEIPKFPLPKLDPFELEFIEIGLIENFEISMSDIVASGLSDIEIKNLKLNLVLLTFSGQIELDPLILTTDYKAKGEIPGFFEIDGEGKIHMEIGINVDIQVKLIVDKEKKIGIDIKKLEPKISINKFRITGLFPDDELNEFLENLVEDMGEELIDNFWQKDKAIYINLLQELINAQIDLTLAELLELINSDKPIFDETDPKPDCKDPRFLDKIYPNKNVLLV